MTGEYEFKAPENYHKMSLKELEEENYLLMEARRGILAQQRLLQKVYSLKEELERAVQRGESGDGQPAQLISLG